MDLFSSVSSFYGSFRPRPEERANKSADGEEEGGLVVVVVGVGAADGHAAYSEALAGPFLR
jgi:hypothetical protein